MNFYQTNKREKSRQFSEDNFSISLTELVTGCVPDFKDFLIDFLTDKELLDYVETSPIYMSAAFDLIPIEEREIIDYHLDIGSAFHILYKLYFKNSSEEYKNALDLRIRELNEAVGPRTGERVMSAY